MLFRSINTVSKRIVSRVPLVQNIAPLSHGLTQCRSFASPPVSRKDSESQLVMKEEPVEDRISHLSRKLSRRIGKEITEMNEEKFDEEYLYYLKKVGMTITPPTTSGRITMRYDVGDYHVKTTCSLYHDASNIGMDEKMIDEKEFEATGGNLNPYDYHLHSFIVEIKKKNHKDVIFRVLCRSDLEGSLDIMKFQTLMLTKSEKDGKNVYLEEYEQQEHNQFLLIAQDPRWVIFEDCQPKMKLRVAEFLDSLNVDNRLATLVQVQTKISLMEAYHRNISLLRDWLK